jgi:hypothetical protein
MDGMHLFFNDPRVAQVTRHRRILRPPLVGLVAGGIGVAALGVVIGSATYSPPQQHQARDDGAIAMPFATPRVGV